VKVLDDSRPAIHRVVDSFLSKFFPSGYPYRLEFNFLSLFVILSKLQASHYFYLFFLSVSEGYLRYTQFRALQHCTSAALSVLSTQVFSPKVPILSLKYIYSNEN
jgi:hypothetical protein